MNKFVKSLVVLIAACVAPLWASAAQTVVFLRHAEKPALGLGQLTCQGLNRALALPRVLSSKFDTPVELYAPNPGAQKEDKGVRFSYIRPLATIEPTAVRLGLPVDATLKFTDVTELNARLLRAELADKTVIVAWEHHLARQAVVDLLDALSPTHAAVAPWADDDFDVLYVVRVEWKDGKPVSASLTLDKQGLNGLPTQCPN